jgi:hypothetical protein
LLISFAEIQKLLTAISNAVSTMGIELEFDTALAGKERHDMVEIDRSRDL